MKTPNFKEHRKRNKIIINTKHGKANIININITGEDKEIKSQNKNFTYSQRMLTFNEKDNDSPRQSHSGRENKTTERENLITEENKDQEKGALERIKQMKEVSFGNKRKRSFGKIKNRKKKKILRSKN